MSTATEAMKTTLRGADENSISASAAHLWRDIKKSRPRAGGWGSSKEILARWNDLLHGHVGVKNDGSPRFVDGMNQAIERAVSHMSHARINSERWLALKGCNAEIFRRNPKRCQYSPAQLDVIEQEYREQRHHDASKAGMKSGSGHAA